MSRMCSGYGPDQGPGCKLLRCEPVEALMGPAVVMVVPTSCDELAGLAVTDEQGRHTKPVLTTLGRFSIVLR